jgi:hypothetical protein
MPRTKKPRGSFTLGKPHKEFLQQETKRLDVYESEVVRFWLDVGRGARPFPGPGVQPQREEVLKSSLDEDAAVPAAPAAQEASP